MSDSITPHEAVLLTIHSNDGRWRGRTAMQKLVYFACVRLGVTFELPYQQHFFGPFSADVAAAIAELSAFEFVDEVHRFGPDRNKYWLTDDGIDFAKDLSSTRAKEFKEIKSIVRKCKELCDLESRRMSVAAKAHYILSNRNTKGSQYTKKEVRDVAKKFDWNLSDDDITVGISLLYGLELLELRE